MEDKVNISIDNYLNNKGIKYSLLNYIYRYHSYYDLKIIGDPKSDIIFLLITNSNYEMITISHLSLYLKN